MKIRRSYFSEKVFRRNRVVAVVASLLLHSLVIFGVYFYLTEQAGIIGPNSEDLNFGSSGGGGEEFANKDAPVEFGAHQATQEETSELYKIATVHLIDIHIQQEMVNAVPVPVIEKPKSLVARKPKPRKSIIAENLPIGHVRHGGQGPGSLGGMGGGSGGGIGARAGYSIDWGGTGGRRLLSGRIPQYPNGTDKEMAVILEFSVLPDGSVVKIIPTRKTDELLERAAVEALRTWRFEPLPTQLTQNMQMGEATFSFTFKQSTKGEQQ